VNPDFPLTLARESYPHLSKWLSDEDVPSDALEVSIMQALAEIDRLRMVGYRLQHENTQLRNTLAVTRSDLAKAQTTPRGWDVT